MSDRGGHVVYKGRHCLCASGAGRSARRQMLLLAGDLRTITESWLDIRDKTTFARNVFNRLHRAQSNTVAAPNNTGNNYQDLLTASASTNKLKPMDAQLRRPNISDNQLSVRSCRSNLNLSSLSKHDCDASTTSQDDNRSEGHQVNSVSLSVPRIKSDNCIAATSNYSNRVNEAHTKTGRESSGSMFHRKLSWLGSNISTGFGGRSISSWLLGDRNSSATSDSLINISGIVFEAMAKNMVPIFTIIQPDLTCPKSCIDPKILSAAHAERKKQIEAKLETLTAPTCSIPQSQSPNTLTNGDSTQQQLIQPSSARGSIISQLAWQTAVITHPYCQYFENFGEFWTGVVNVLANYKGPSNQGMTLEHLNSMIMTLGMVDERSCSPIPPLTDSSTLLFLKSAILEELLACHVRQWHNRMYGSESSGPAGTAADYKSILLASTFRRKDSKSRSPRRKCCFRAETRAEKGSRFSRKCCQTMRSWYKLVSFVLAEAKDAYLHEQIRRQSHISTAAAAPTPFHNESSSLS